MFSSKLDVRLVISVVITCVNLNKMNLHVKNLKIERQPVHYRPSICPCRIRVQNALKTHVKRISFPTRISKIQSKPTIHMRWTAVQRIYLLTNQ